MAERRFDELIELIAQKTTPSHPSRLKGWVDANILFSSEVELDGCYPPKEQRYRDLPPGGYNLLGWRRGSERHFKMRAGGLDFEGQGRERDD